MEHKSNEELELEMVAKYGMKLKEMVDGHMAGFNDSSSELPERYKDKSVAFKHGWTNGKNDRMSKVPTGVDVLRRRAEMILNTKTKE